MSVCVTARQAFRKCLLLFDRGLTERSATKTVAKSVMMLPKKSQEKALQASNSSDCGIRRYGKVWRDSVSVKAGEEVLLPEYQGTKVVQMTAAIPYTEKATVVV